jgi:hypothetical protein
MARRTGTELEVTPTEARQGFLDRPVLVVLIASVALVCVAFAAIFFGYWPM